MAMGLTPSGLSLQCESLVSQDEYVFKERVGTFCFVVVNCCSTQIGNLYKLITL